MDKKALKVYYCSAMDGLRPSDISDEYKRVELILTAKKCTLINPYNDAMGGLAFTKENADLIVNENLKILANADVVLINFSIKNHTYVGCIGEMIHAKINKLKVISFVGDNDIGNHFWTLYHSDHIVKTLDEAMTLL